ncbi:hypothetical protein PV327_006148 [Microctonus hyperodae]|uniref:FUN14 domain-containing protein 1 n=1 Tax=Microctonus hyperodae TaxID=165561 RepID=A0AA39L0K7_MICHY|nr:hypothetical protein PV327_006148 [Microctonus hyperodae]
MGLPSKSRNQTDINKDEIEEIDMTNEAKGFIDRMLGDVSKTSATKQIFIGASSGWITGFLAMKVGKVIAFSVGGGIIILQIAATQGYIKINWDKIQRKAEKLTDKVEEKITGEGPKFFDKMERFVDKKLDKAELLVKNSKVQSRRWYHRFTDSKDTFRARELHFFIGSFAAGVAIGLATGN